MSDQQHNIAGTDHCRLVQEPMASVVVLQVDQAALAHKAFSGQQGECSQDANLVRRVDLSAHCHRQEGALLG
jgi:hypothetical protein